MEFKTYEIAKEKDIPVKKNSDFNLSSRAKIFHKSNIFE